MEVSNQIVTLETSIPLAGPPSIEVSCGDVVTPARSSTPYKMNTANGLPGSQERPYRMLIVGGGPAGTAVVTRAIRLGHLSELCGHFGNSAGLCIVDRGPASRLGGGKLLDYEINSNTWGEKFALNVTLDKPNAIPAEYVTGTPLEVLRKSAVGQKLVEAGNSCVPLSLVGEFLVETGQILKDSIEMFKSSKVMCDTAVREIQQVIYYPTSGTAPVGSPAPLVTGSPRELWRVALQRTRAPSMMSPGSFVSGKGMEKVASSEEEIPAEVYAEVVVLASGGLQPIAQSLHPLHAQKAISSDFVCTKQGIEVLADMLAKAKAPVGGPASSKDRKVVIIGGSHSAFSAAWICLNKLDSQKVLFSSGSICLLHRSPVLVFYPSKRDAETDGYTDIKHVNRNGQIHPFGGIRGDAKQLYRHIRNGRETRVRMLLMKCGSESPAAVKLMDEAAVIIWSCGYKTNAIPLKDVNGQDIPLRYSFGQVEVDENAQVLREPMEDTSIAAHALNAISGAAVTGSDVISTPSVDAETPSASLRDTAVVSPELILSIKKNDALIQKSAASPRKSAKITIPVTHSAPSTPAVKINAVISGSSMNKLKPQPLKNLFATGLGYGLQATFDNGEPDGSSGRADGVAVYLKRSATLILSAVLGTKVYGDNCKNWKERVALGLAQAATASKKHQFPLSPVRPATSATVEARGTNGKQPPDSPSKVKITSQRPQTQKPNTAASPRRSSLVPSQSYYSSQEKQNLLDKPASLKNVQPVLNKTSSKSSGSSKPIAEKVEDNESQAPKNSKAIDLNYCQNSLNVLGSESTSTTEESVVSECSNIAAKVLNEYDSINDTVSDPLVQLWEVSKSTDSASLGLSRPITVTWCSSVVTFDDEIAMKSNHAELPQISRPATVKNSFSAPTGKVTVPKRMFDGNRLNAPVYPIINSSALRLSTPLKKVSAPKSAVISRDSTQIAGVKYCTNSINPSDRSNFYKKPPKFNLASFDAHTLVSKAIVDPYFVSVPACRRSMNQQSTGSSVGNSRQAQLKVVTHRSANGPAQNIPPSKHIADRELSAVVLTHHGVVNKTLEDTAPSERMVALSPIRPSSSHNGKRMSKSSVNMNNNRAISGGGVHNKRKLMSTSLPGHAHPLSHMCR